MRHSPHGFGIPQSGIVAVSMIEVYAGCTCKLVHPVLGIVKLAARK